LIVALQQAFEVEKGKLGVIFYWLGLKSAFYIQFQIVSLHFSSQVISKSRRGLPSLEDI